MYSKRIPTTARQRRMPSGTGLRTATLARKPRRLEVTICWGRCQLEVDGDFVHVGDLGIDQADESAAALNRNENLPRRELVAPDHIILHFDHLVPAVHAGF